MASPADADAVAVAVAQPNTNANLNGAAADDASQSQSQSQPQPPSDSLQASAPTTKRKREDSDDGDQNMDDADVPKSGPALVLSEDQPLRDEKDLIKNYFQVLQRYATADPEHLLAIAAFTMPHATDAHCWPHVFAWGHDRDCHARSILPLQPFPRKPHIYPFRLRPSIPASVLSITYHPPVSTLARQSSSDLYQNHPPPMSHFPKNKSPTTAPSQSASKTRSIRMPTNCSISWSWT